MTKAEIFQRAGCVLAEEKECELYCSLCVIEGFGISADGLLKCTEIKVELQDQIIQLACDGESYRSSSAPQYVPQKNSSYHLIC